MRIKNKEVVLKEKSIFENMYVGLFLRVPETKSYPSMGKCFYKGELPTGFLLCCFSVYLHMWRSEVGSLLWKCVSRIPRSGGQTLQQVLYPLKHLPLSPCLIESFYLKCMLKSKVFYKAWEHIHCST